MVGDLRGVVLWWNNGWAKTWSRTGCGGINGSTIDDYDHRRTWLHARRLPPRIARRGVEASDRLGRHRGVIERWLAWLTGYRRLTLRYERCARLFTAFLTLAVTLTCYKRLATWDKLL